MTKGTPMHIEAAVLRSHTGPNSLETVDLPAPGPGQLLVRIVAAGFCHTDVLPRQPGLPAQPPIITGHEGSGFIEALGPGVHGPATGTPVVLAFDSCGRCANCRSAHPAYCEEFFARNLSASSAVTDAEGESVAAGWFGQSSFATHALATERNVVPVAADLPLELLAPLGCGIQTGAGSILLSLGVRAGDSVVVLGAGGVGLAAVMAARVAGATTIVAVDRHENRLALAEKLGATHAVQSGEDVLARRLRKLTAGGAQYCLDTTGVPELITHGIDALRPTGTIGLVGMQSRELSLGPAALSAGKNIRGILEGDAVPQHFLPRLVELWRQGRFPFETLVRNYPLSRIDEAEADAASGAVIKPVLLPGA